MAVLGDAWVVLRAITKNLNRDVEKGLDDAGKAADAAGKKVGEDYGKGIGDGASDEIRRAGSKISDALADAIDSDRGRGAGIKIASGLVSGLMSGLSGLAGLAGIAAMVIGLTGAIGGLVGALGALVAGAVAVTAALGPAMAAIGIVGAASIAALLPLIGAGVGIFSQLTGELSEMSPKAAEVRGSFDALKNKFKELFEEIGNAEDGPLDALGTLLDELGGDSFPVIAEGMRRMSESIAAVISQVRELFESPLFKANLGTFFDTSANLVEEFGSGLVSLTGAFFGLMAAAAPVIEMFGEWFSGWAEGIATQVRAGQETGKLAAFFQRAGEVAAQFFDIMGNVWDVLKDVMKAAMPLGGVLLSSLQQGSQALSNFTSSAQGAEKMFDFFKPGGQVHENLSATWGLIKELGQSLVELTRAEGVEKLASGITRVLPGVTEVIVAAIDAVGEFAEAIADGFTSPAGVKGVEAIRDGVEKLGGAFAELGPAIGPLMQIIGDLGSNLANVLGPAFRQLSDMLPSLVGPLDRVGAALGNVLGEAISALLELLPPLVEIVAKLAEALDGPLVMAIGAAAGIVSPLLNVLADLLGVLEPILPMIVALAGAFLAFRQLSGIGALFQQMGGFMQFAGQAGGRMGTAIGTAGTALSGLGQSLPLVGAAIVGFSALVDSQNKSIDSWVEKLGQGGRAAADAQREMANPSVWQTVRTNMLHLFEDGSAASKIQDEVNQKLRDQIALMGPLEKAQFFLNKATEDYAYAVERGSAGSEAARAAKESIAFWTEKEQVASYNAARANEDYATAAQMVADSIWAKIDAELASSNAGIVAEQSAIRMAEAYQRMIDVQNDPNADPLKRRDAELAYQSALNTTTAALQGNATAFAETAVANGQFATNGEAMAFSLREQAAQYETLAGTVQGPYRDALLEAARIAREQADKAFSLKVETGGAIQGIQEFSNYMFSQPKTFDTEITITGTDAVSQQVASMNDKLASLSGLVPVVEIDAVTDEADAKIQAILGDLDDIDGTTPQASVDVQTSMAREQLRGVLTDMLTVDGQQPTAEVIAYVDQAMVGLDSVMTGMLEANGAKATPQVLLDAALANEGLRYVDGQLVSLDGKVATPDANLDPAAFNAEKAAADAALAALDAAKATPNAFLDPNAFNAAMGAAGVDLTRFDARVAVPDADLNASPFNGISAGINSALTILGGRVASPTVSVRDQASNTIANIAAQIAALRDRTVTITTRSATVQEPGVQGMGRAAGGGRINTDAWTTVGEEGREMVFLSQGQYVATYHKARQILAAASMQAAGAAAMTAGNARAMAMPAPTASGGGINVPIIVNPSEGMDELALARKTGSEFAFRFRRLT